MVVTGTNTKVHFTNACFLDCCLVVTDGATATLADSCFSQNHNSGSSSSSSRGISIYSTGAGSSVILQGGSITGGLWGAIITDGASMSAEKVQMIGEDWVAVEVQGIDTSLSLKSCILEDHTAAAASVLPTEAVQKSLKSASVQSVGVVVGSGATCSVVDCDIRPFRVGLSASHSHLNLLRTSIKGCLQSCCSLRGFLSADITECVMKGSVGAGEEAAGLSITNLQSPDGSATGYCNRRVATVQGCSLTDNQCTGVCVSGKVHVELFDCRAERNHRGFAVMHGATVLSKDCTSRHNGHGVTVSNSTLVAENVTVQFCDSAGVLLHDAAEALLQDCRIMHTGVYGVCATTKASATLKECFIGCDDTSAERLSLQEGLSVNSGAFVLAESSRMVGSQRFGVCVDGDGSKAKLKDCLVQVHDTDAVTVAVSSVGSLAMHRCTVHGGRCGVHARHHAFVLLESCCIDRAIREACVASHGARMQLLQCCIQMCGTGGVVAVNTRTSVFAFGCTITRCGGTAVMCSTGAQINMHELQSYNNRAGFQASKGGTMHLERCFSGDVAPYCVQEMGSLHCVNCIPSNEFVPTISPWY